MSIQFNKEGMCTVSIKNRYNHTVENPDATYGNNLDRIIPGLTDSFLKLLRKEYGLELNETSGEKFSIPGYKLANDGKYYKYNEQINGTYYCPGNIVIKQGEIIKVANPDEELLVDYFRINKKEKKIEVCSDIKDSFVDDLQEIEKIEVVKLKKENKSEEAAKSEEVAKSEEIVKSKDENIDRVIKIYQKGIEEPVLIGIGKNNQIVKYKNNNITQVGDNFLRYNEELSQLELPNVTQENNGTISAKDIAQLDKEKNISTSELNIAGKNIAELVKDAKYAMFCLKKVKGRNYKNGKTKDSKYRWL